MTKRNSGFLQVNFKFKFLKCLPKLVMIKPVIPKHSGVSFTKLKVVTSSGREGAVS